MTRRHVRWFAAGLLLAGIVFVSKVSNAYGAAFVGGCIFATLMITSVLVGWPKDGTR